MMGFRDMTFCAAECLTVDCPRQFDERQKAAAARWWGGPGAPVAFGNLSNGCDDYLPAGGVDLPQTPDRPAEDSQEPRADDRKRSAQDHIVDADEMIPRQTGEGS